MSPDLGDDESSKSRHFPFLVWQEAENGYEDAVSVSSFVSGSQSANSTKNHHYDHLSHEVSVSLEHAEECPSPSSISLQHSLTDLSVLGTVVAAIPPLPLNFLTHDISIESCTSNPLIGSYRSRRRRRLEREHDSNSRDFDREGSRDQQLQLNKHPLQDSLSEHSPPSYSSGESIELGSSGSKRGSSRFVLMLCLLTLAVLAIHDRMESYQQPRHNASSASRREEVAFPLGQPKELMVSASRSFKSTRGVGERLAKENLPKYYLPKLEPNHGTLTEASAPKQHDFATQTQSRSSLRQHQHGSNFAMARSQESRPIFVPDQPLSDGRFRTPVERFVFDPDEQRKQFSGQRRVKSRALSWTSWLASVAFVCVLLDTGWKEYNRCRLLEEEQRRL